MASEKTKEDVIFPDWFTRLMNSLLCRGDLAEEKLETQPVSTKELFRFSTKKDRFMIAIGLFLAAIVGVLQASSWILTGFIANLYLTNKDKIGNDHLYWSVFHWCLALAVFALVLLVTSYFQSFLLLSACTRIVQRIRCEYVKAVLRQDATWFETNDAGRLSAQLNNNIERIQDGIADKFGLIVRGFSNFIFSATISFFINWRVTMIAFLSGPLAAITMGLMTKSSSKPMKESIAGANEASAIAEEAIMNAKTVAACNGQETMIKKYSSVLQRSLKKTIQLHFLNGFFEGLMFFQIYFFFAGAIFYGIVVYFESAPFEPGTILIAVNTTQLGGYFLSLLAPHLMALLKARVSAAVIYHTIDRTPKIDPACQKGREMQKCRGDINFKNVHFKYPSRETKILNGCSWEAKAGETVAFVGHSGCGKSTSIGLLTRLYDNCAGEITIDGTPIEEIRLTDLRKSIGIVQQEPCLFNGTIRENIILGRDISNSMVAEAAKIANAHEFIMKLKDGYDTLLGVGGVALSGGQKQRIAIARAIASDPKILLLDEATSALDTESERVVQFALNKASRGRTTIVIAHRLSTLKDVNKIHVIDKGIVAEAGSHSELMATKRLYWAQAKAQEVGITEERKQKDSDEVTKISTSPVPTDFIRFSDRSSLSLRASKTRKVTRDEETFPEVDKNGDKTVSKNDNILFRLYGSRDGRWLKILVFVFCFLRGLELPAYSLLQILPFLALEQDKETYMPYLLYSVLAFLLIGVWLLIFITAAVGFGGWASEITVNSLKTSVLRSLLHRDAAFFDKPGKSNAACVSTLALRSPEVNAFLDYRFMIFSNSIIALVVATLITYFNFWKMGVVTTLLLALFILCVGYLSYQMTKSMKLKSQVDKTAEFAIEIFEQAKTIQLMSVESYFSDRFTRQQEMASVIQNKLDHLQSAIFMMSVSAVYIFDFCGYLVSASAIYAGEISAARGITAAMTATYAGWSTVFAIPTYSEVVEACSAAKDLFSLIGNTGKNLDAGTCPKIEGELSVEKLTFAYPSRPNVKVARSLNLRAKKGQAIALVGASGCGKSTIIQLLERFYTPDSGDIKIDKNNILDIELRHLRSNISLVGQEPILFKGSIFENIVLGCEDDVTMEDVKRVAEVANAAKFIEAFPQGYETDVGEKGSALSGGQKQRIAIARALIRNPKVLLLDEATSALDTENEKKVQKALNDASTGRTSVSIAHRLSTIRNADRIYFIENGSVVEYGTHDDLIEADGKYARLVEAQALLS